MPKYDENTQYEKRTMVASVPVTNSPRNFMVISRIRPVEQELPDSIDIRRFFTSRHNDVVRPTSKGIHIKLDMVEDVLAGIWMALTPDERKRCMDKILKIEEVQ